MKTEKSSSFAKSTDYFAAWQLPLIINTIQQYSCMEEFFKIVFSKLSSVLFYAILCFLDNEKFL